VSDTGRAIDALKALLALKTINKDARYYAEVALSHLQTEKTNDRPEAQTPEHDGEHPRG
jgi:hypothetical protein